MNDYYRTADGFPTSEDVHDLKAILRDCHGPNGTCYFTWHGAAQLLAYIERLEGATRGVALPRDDQPKGGA